MLWFIVIFYFGCVLTLTREPTPRTFTEDVNISAPGNINVPSRQKRSIAGGYKTLTTEFPHMAALGIKDNSTITWVCGGSLISSQFVLTAAHCLRNTTIEVVRLGDLDLESDTDDARPQTFGVKRKILHPDYAYPQKYHDIALIELDRPVTQTEYVLPARLSRRKDIPKTMIATGWGKTSFIGGYSSHLLKVGLNYVENDKCNEYYKNKQRYLPRGILEELQICAGDVKGRDTCGGDSGGPLQVRRQHLTSFKVNAYELVGITSFGNPCTLSNSPGVFTRILSYIPWIQKKVWSEFI